MEVAFQLYSFHCVERILLDMADCPHFKSKRSQNSARSLNCTAWKSAFKDLKIYDPASSTTRCYLNKKSLLKFDNCNEDTLF